MAGAEAGDLLLRVAEILEVGTVGGRDARPGFDKQLSSLLEVLLPVYTSAFAYAKANVDCTCTQRFWIVPSKRLMMALSWVQCLKMDVDSSRAHCVVS